jgi:serine-type D-Ala-D-Ala carboxypeptidase/endopeptidase (penicillin-binding protein 4)
MKLKYFLWLLTGLAFTACSSSRFITDSLKQTEKDFRDHIGFVLYDVSSQKTICDFQGERNFTPASNTKIFTFYTSLQILGDSIPALRYTQRNDSMIFWGTGAPGFLYENTAKEDRVYNFLRNWNGKLFFSSDNFQTDHLGSGWMWDDYNDTDQTERTSFPVYGNYSKVKKLYKSVEAIPDVFTYDVKPATTKERSQMIRAVNSNALTYLPGKTDRPKEWKIPFRYSDQLLAKLLTDTLNREVSLIQMTLPSDARYLYSTVVPDSLYKVMMQASDNFIAEQLLLVCSDRISDSLRTEISINYAKKNLLSDLPDEPLWVDGSGLSRYNLFTPRSVVKLWEKIYTMVPRDRLFQLLAIGGRKGTIKNYYKAEKPYIFGKTGSLSNNHILSGYLVTKQGQTLIFSWMNNNFATPTGEVRGRMEALLKQIYEKY